MQLRCPRFLLPPPGFHRSPIYRGGGEPGGKKAIRAYLGLRPSCSSPDLLLAARDSRHHHHN